MITDRLQELEGKLGKPYEAFPDRCRSVVQEIYGRPIDVSDCEEVPHDQVMPGDLVLMGEFHIGVIGSTGEYVIHADMGIGLVNQPLHKIKGKIRFYRPFF